jgi:hypothetical protein
MFVVMHFEVIFRGKIVRGEGGVVYHITLYIVYALFHYYFYVALFIS